MSNLYQPDWRSLIGHTTPQWLRDDKFGIYTHWGVYSVPACGKNGTWYPYFMYQKGNPQHDFHVNTYGPPSQFGYKDFIPMFTAERFDPDEWAELFARSGARFAGPVAEHHDGFAMWDSALSEWNAAKMGPKQDIVAGLARAIRAQGMRYMVALHHAELWYFYPHWEKTYDTSDPRYAGLYGEPHDLRWIDDPPDIPKGPFRFWRMQTRPDKSFHEYWLNKAQEVIDGYRPDLLWLDNGILFLQESYLRQLAAYYYNKGEEWGESVALTYKMNELVPGSALVDLELGRFEELTYHEWITDTSVDDQGAWSYVKDAPIKPAEALIHNLVDNVSKNGYLLVNVGPRPDGTIPKEVQQRLVGMGKWLEINGEAIYGTTPWLTFGEGPTKMEKAGPFSERQEVRYTPQDVRFTSRDNALYAICLGWPEGETTITSCGQLYEGEIEAVTMLGSDQPLSWRLDPTGLKVETPRSRPCEHAYVFKISRKDPFEGSA
jgi:alpha-L-fucosidase